jgi:hypothetical protein
VACASVLFFGKHGDVTQAAEERGVSRQRLYREADSVVTELDTHPLQQENAALRQQLAEVQAELDRVRSSLSNAIVITPQKQAEFACTAQAEGVSLPVANRLFAVVCKKKIPSVAKLGRFSHEAGEKAKQLLEVFDEHARPRVRQVAADEIFFGQKPVLMVVEPDSQCWLSGRMSDTRDGKEWAKEIEVLPALEHLTRDGAKGLKNGLARVNEQRKKDKKEPIRDQLDHFHTLREGRRALRKVQAKAERALSHAEEAQKKVAKRQERGQSCRGYQTQVTRAWHVAEKAFDEWTKVQRAFEKISQALRPMTPEGKLNTRELSKQAVDAVLPELSGELWGKFRRCLEQEESYAYLDGVEAQIAGLKMSEDLREAVVGSEGVRQNPALVEGEGERACVLRGLLVVWSVVISLWGETGKQAVSAVRQAVRCSGRASSCVEGVNSVVRMQQCRHRKMTQGLLDLKRLYWNLRKFRTGRRKNTCPYERLGISLPPNFSWWQLLQLTPDQLRALLSATPQAA